MYQCVQGGSTVKQYSMSGRRSEEHLLVTIPSLPIGPIRRVLAKTY